MKRPDRANISRKTVDVTVQENKSQKYPYRTATQITCITPLTCFLILTRISVVVACLLYEVCVNVIFICLLDQLTIDPR